MREALRALDEKGTLTLVRKAASARYFTLSVSRRGLTDTRYSEADSHNRTGRSTIVRCKAFSCSCERQKMLQSEICAARLDCISIPTPQRISHTFIAASFELV